MGLAAISPNIPLLLTGVLCIPLTIFLIMCMPETKFKPIAKEKNNYFENMLLTVKSGARLIKNNKIILSMVIIIGIEGIYSEAFDRLWSMRFFKDIPPTNIENCNTTIWFLIINLVAMLLSILLTEFVKRTLENKKKYRLTYVLILVNVAMMCSVIIFALAGNFYTCISILLVMLYNETY